jgi:hypothetical protein
MKTETTCPSCKRVVTVSDGRVCTHGPGPRGQFICPGSGDKRMVEAAAHINVNDIPAK